MKERWKVIYDGYYKVSDRGKIIRIALIPKGYFGKRIAIGISNKGYQRVTLQKQRKKFNKFVHVLVAEAFVGPQPPGKEVDHKDMDRQNNFWKNLHWVTHQKNTSKEFRRRKR